MHVIQGYRNRWFWHIEKNRRKSCPIWMDLRLPSTSNPQRCDVTAVATVGGSAPLVLPPLWNFPFPIVLYHFHLTKQWVLVTWWPVPCFLKFLLEFSHKSSVSSAPVTSAFSNPTCTSLFRLVCDMVTLSITLHTKRVIFNCFCILLGLVQFFSSYGQSLFTCTL